MKNLMKYDDLRIGITMQDCDLYGSTLAIHNRTSIENAGLHANLEPLILLEQHN